VSEIEDFLHSHRSDGRVDSCGEFDVNWVRAEALASKNLLQNPEQWMLKIVQTMVRTAPEEIQIYHRSDRINFCWKVTHDPNHPRQDFSSLFSSAALKHLKVGLAAYQGFGGSSIQYIDPDGRKETLMGSDVLDQSAKAQPDWHCLSFKQLTKKKWFTPGGYPSERLLTNHCNCSPIPISIDGKQLAQSLQKASLSSLYLQPTTSSEDGSQYSVEPLNQREWKRTQLDLLSREELRADNLIWATLEISRDSWSESRWVVDGVATPWERNTLDRPGWHITMSSAGLSSDLTGLNVVDAPEAVIRRKKLCLIFAQSSAFSGLGSGR
jgi:hypothetical protein